jgi:signal transduction histidine kinase
MALELANNQKLVAIGTLAGGILHEIRNPINALVAAANVIKEREPAQTRNHKMFEVVFEAIDRICGITDALDSHVRPADGGHTASCDVRRALEATLMLLSHRLGEVEVDEAYLTETPAAAPAGPLNQVFMNLLDNAINAGADHIWIKVEEADAALRISIADDGHGVPSSIAQRIFDPFFTTREPGKGQGLGLYLCEQIVRQHAGRLEHRSRGGGGAEFVIELPT